MAPVAAEHSEFSYLLLVRVTTAASLAQLSMSFEHNKRTWFENYLPFWETYPVGIGVFDVAHMFALAGPYRAMSRESLCEN